MADLIAEGLQEGYWDLITAAIPETCGHDIEVPEIMLNFGDSLPLRVTFVSFAIQAARMSTPGAAISGCKARRQENNLFTHIPR